MSSAEKTGCCEEGLPLLLEEGVSTQDRVLADVGAILGTAKRGTQKRPNHGRVSWRTLAVLQVHSLFRHRERRSMTRLRLALHLVILWLLVVPGGCAEWAYRQMNDPSRDVWQQPKTVIQALSIAPGSRVADLGAGGGYFTWRLAEAVGPEGKVYAVDVDETALRLIEQERAQRGVAHVELVRATPTDARLPVAGVDLIFTCNTYHHLPDRTTYFQSLARALRPGGRIAVIEYKDSGWLAGHSTPKETVLREMEAAGYRLIREFDFLPKQHFLVFGPIRS